MAGRVTRQDVAACLAHYPAIGRLLQVRAISGRFVNAIFRVSTDLGTYYLKVLSLNPEASTEAQYDYLDWVMGHAAAIGLAVPQAVRNAEGGRLTSCGRYPAVLSAAVPGGRFRPERLSHQRAAGIALGRFHRQAVLGGDRASSWMGPLGCYLLHDESLLSHLPEAPERERVVAHFPELLARSRRVAQELQEVGFADLPRTTIHQEFVDKHLRVKGGRVVAVLDFEAAAFDARLSDVAVALARGSLGPEAVKGGPQRTRAFLRGYNSAGWPLAAEELAALPVVASAWDFEHILFWVHQLVETQRPTGILDHPEFISGCLWRADWWEQHRNEAAELLRWAQG